VNDKTPNHGGGCGIDSRPGKPITRSGEIGGMSSARRSWSAANPPPIRGGADGIRTPDRFTARHPQCSTELSSLCWPRRSRASPFSHVHTLRPVGLGLDQRRRRSHDLAAKLDAGTVWVNAHLVLANEVPWGGFKGSGYGRDLSLYALDDYSRTKHVMHNVAR
jgi:hypothetical protein